MKSPKLYTKKDGKYYFTFRGKQHYGGKTLEQAQTKLKEVTGIGIIDQTCVVRLVGEYLDSLVGTQSPDTIYGKATSYKQLLAFLSKRKPKNGTATPGLYSLHDASKAKEKHASYVDAFSSLFPESIPLTTFNSDALERYRRAYLKTARKSTVKTAFIKIQALSKWLHEKGCLAENPYSWLSVLPPSAVATTLTNRFRKATYSGSIEMWRSRPRMEKRKSDPSSEKATRSRSVRARFVRFHLRGVSTSLSPCRTGRNLG